jgi:putative membrane protein
MGYRADMMDGWDSLAGLWMLGGILVIAVAVLIGVWMVLRSNREAHPSGPTALDILRERYARGEISAEEFEAAKRTLGA